MQVMTVAEGRVPASRSKEFENAYMSLRKGRLPEGLVESSLLRDENNPEIYRIATVWESREILEKNRKIWEEKNQLPAAVLLFKKVGAEPELRIFDIREKISVSAK